MTPHELEQKDAAYPTSLAVRGVSARLGRGLILCSTLTPNTYALVWAVLYSPPEALSAR